MVHKHNVMIEISAPKFFYNLYAKEIYTKNARTLFFCIVTPSQTYFRDLPKFSKIIKSNPSKSIGSREDRHFFARGKN